MKCLSCVFFDGPFIEQNHFGDVEYGLCRRHAPSPEMQEGKPREWPAWPKVKCGERCGDFQDETGWKPL